MGEVLGGNHLAGNRQDSGGLSGATTEEAGVQEATAADWLRSSRAGEASVYSMVVVVVVNNAAVGQQTQWCTQHSRCSRDNRKETEMETVDNRGSKSNGDSGVGLADDNSLAGSSITGSDVYRQDPRLLGLPVTAQGPHNLELADAMPLDWLLSFSLFTRQYDMHDFEELKGWFHIFRFDIRRQTLWR